MKELERKKALVTKLSFITTPAISYTGVVEHKNSKIFLNGVSRKSEVWAESEENADSVLDDLIVVMQDYDPKFEIKLLTTVGRDDERSYHPSSCNWAYSQIPLEKIPKLQVTEKDMERIRQELKKLESAPW